MSSYAFLGTKRRTRVGNLIAGIGSIAAIWPTVTATTRPPARSDLDALRGDSVRIGADMRRVIDRERARAQTAEQE